MQFAGILPEDAPDPRDEVRARLAALEFLVYGFAPQPHLEDADVVGWESSSDGESTVSIGYTLWRNPDDRSDPANLAELDEATRRALDEEPPWPRPRWLVESAERMRYPMLWEAVRTSLRPVVHEWSTPEALLLSHIHHIHMNRFAEEIGWDVPPRDFVEQLVSPASIRHGIDVIVDGEAIPGMEVDTDPFVYALASELPSGGVLTAVVPRDDLPLIRLAFARRAAGA